MRIGLAHLRFQSPGEKAAGTRKTGRWAREEDVSGVTR